MQNPLDESQSELLSAYLDGELTEVERKIVDELLKRDDARAYLESLRATVSLVTQNAPVRAPVGLSGRVMSNLKDEFKQSVDPGSEPFTAIPRISWQAPIWAAAAAIVVSVAIMFGPSLFNTRPQGPEIARDVLENLPQASASAEQPEQGIGEKPAATDALDFDKSTLEEMERGVTERMKKGEHLDDASAKGNTRRLSEDEAQNDPADADSNRFARRSAGAPAKEPGIGGGWGGGAAGGREELGKSKDDKQGAPSEPGRNRDANSEADGENSAAEADDRDLEEAKRESRGGVAPPAAPAEQPQDDAAPSNEAGDAAEGSAEAHVLTMTEAGSLAAQTDVLWISKLYGSAKIVESDDAVESVEVEVDADKLPELMAALRKLAEDQGYGSVSGSDALNRLEQARPSAKSVPEEDARRISGYLPAQDDPEPEASELDAGSRERVKLVIRMK